ncbi:MAG: hypothetical protein HON47_01945 [Candidatus Diapherotrites archaeon]|jgi:hypothetical protein|uniref:Uncharacterized protein n=1 Tax=Candidatus Iainarchaeum sp. TaxID=3101447 RepID=A0A8T5GEY4_9ARCH|nr:hypothetical protein [Candidatus Diapherotrites archaeon]MBT7241107.1 hypothetical protein [Candidatus Diapherotrites archaeon]
MNKFLKNNRYAIIAIVLVALVSFAIGTAVDVTGTPAAGATPIFVSGTTWNPSSVSGDGNGITFDGNTMCFVTGTGACDHNVDWNGTDLLLQIP